MMNELFNADLNIIINVLKNKKFADRVKLNVAKDEFYDDVGYLIEYLDFINILTN